MAELMEGPSDTRTAALLARRREAVPRGPFHVAPLFVDRARGALLWDVDGRELIDFCGGIGACNVGHNHPRVVEAIRAQAGRVLHTSFHVAMYEPYVQLAERLNARAPIAAPCKTALFNSGAEACENAVKIARVATGRPAVVSFERGFHGRTLLGMTLTGKVKPYSAGFGPFAPGVHRLPYRPFFGARPEAAGSPAAQSTDGEAVAHACRQALADLGAYHVSPDEVACVIAEPVLGEGGFLPLHPAAARVLRAWCTTHGALLVDDEVQTGFGRCGRLFAIERLGVEPDLVTTAKSLAGGMVLSAVTGRAALMDAPGVGGIGGTYGGNPVACAAANAVLDVIDDEGLCERAEVIGARVLDAFHTLEQNHAHVSGARGVGAMCGLDVVSPEDGRPDPTRAAAICQGAFERGLLVMTASGNVLRTLMPLVIREVELERGLTILADAIAATA